MHPEPNIRNGRVIPTLTNLSWSNMQHTQVNNNQTTEGKGPETKMEVKKTTNDMNTPENKTTEALKLELENYNKKINRN